MLLEFLKNNCTSKLKMAKKVLICEDSEETAECLFDILEKKGYEPFILAKDNDPAYVINCMGKRIKECQPDYILLDGLAGLWTMGVEIAKKANPDISAVILSGDDNLVEKAQKAGFAAFNKSKVSAFDALYEFLKK